MAVLRGLDFARVKPLVIELEFEDGKTKSMGYTSHDLACFLMQQGYVVYVSEWHPVERYGAKHSWRGIQKYPCAIPEESWGNLIAFIQDPSAADLSQAVRRAVDQPVRFAGDPVEGGEKATTMQPGSAPTRKPRKMKSNTPKAILKKWGPVFVALLVAAVAVWALPGAGALLVVLLANLLIAGWMVHKTSKSLKRRSRRQRKLLRRQNKALQRQIGNLQEQFKRRLQNLEHRLNSQAEAQEKTAKLAGAHAQALSRLNGANAVRA